MMVSWRHSTTGVYDSALALRVCLCALVWRQDVLLYWQSLVTPRSTPSSVRESSVSEFCVVRECGTAVTARNAESAGSRGQD